MKLENQVCTLEQAWRLRELGVTQLSCFAYAKKARAYKLCAALGSDEMPLLWENFSSAFTVAELGVMMPWEYNNRTSPFTMACDEGYASTPASIWNTKKGWRYRLPADLDCSEYMSEATARAAFLIYLLESGKITVEQVNARLAAA